MRINRNKIYLAVLCTAGMFIHFQAYSFVASVQYRAIFHAMKNIGVMKNRPPVERGQIVCEGKRCVTRSGAL